MCNEHRIVFCDEDCLFRVSIRKRLVTNKYQKGLNSARLGP